MDGNGFKQQSRECAPKTQKHFRRTALVQIQVEDDRTSTSLETLKRAFLDNLYYVSTCKFSSGKVDALTGVI